MEKIVMLNEMIDVGRIYEVTVKGSKRFQNISITTSDIEDWDYCLQIHGTLKPKKSKPAMPGGMGV